MKKAEGTLGKTLTNGQIVWRLLGLAWQHRLACLRVLAVQIVLLVLGLGGLTFAGMGLDYLRHKIAEDGQVPITPFGLPFPWEAEPLQVLGLIGGLIMLSSFIRAGLNYMNAVWLTNLGQQRIVTELRAQVYEKLQRLSFRFYDANSTGSIINRVTGDVQNARLFVDGVLFQGFIMAISLTVYIVYMTRLHTGLTFACLATTPVLLVFSVVFSRWVQPMYQKNRELYDEMVRRLAESVQGIGVIKAFARERENNAHFCTANDAVMHQQRSIFWRLSIYAPSVGALTHINMAVLLGYGGWLVIHDKLPLGTGLFVFAGLLQQFSGQVAAVTQLANSIQQSLIGARRVFEVLDAPVEVSTRSDARRVTRFSGRVTLEAINFSFRANDTVLENVSIDVRSGECVALLGKTGSGKSALMSLLPRFYDPDSGRVLFDGIDARDIHLEDLRRNIGIVFQESFLFSNTIAANIAFGRPDATQAQIEKAARIAAAHDFISALPKGYETILGESGFTLSGGQRQRLAIARAILLEPPILLLDDPTAAIDSKTEHEIFEALENAIAGRTTFIVAHRLSTLRRADRVVVLDRGRVLQEGTHAELMKKPGPYLEVASLQLSDLQPESDDLEERS